MIILSHLYNLNAFLAIAKPKSLNLVECCRMVRHVPDGLWNVAMKGMRTYDGPMTAHGVRDPGNGIIKFAWENPVKFIGKSTKSPWASFHSKRWVLPEGSHSGALENLQLFRITRFPSHEILVTSWLKGVSQQWVIRILKKHLGVSSSSWGLPQ